LRGKKIDTGSPHVCAIWSFKFFRENAVEYEFRAQAVHDLRRMPVEDASLNGRKKKVRIAGSAKSPSQRRKRTVRRGAFM